MYMNVHVHIPKSECPPPIRFYNGGIPAYADGSHVKIQVEQYLEGTLGYNYVHVWW